MSVRSLNKVMLIGNLTRDPELRYTANGTPVATFGIATNRTWKDTNGDVQESTQYHNIVAWGKMAEICQQILAKGMMVYVEGELVTRSWEAEDGSTRYKTEVRISEMKLLDSKGRQGVGGGDQSNATADTPKKANSQASVEADEYLVEETGSDEDPTDDELPF
ncbi:single-stranded DNA-binding protein [Candidatus Nomurabacteria bacterium]|uniref:Single-stranded DNA-binding protein n=1 Tax=Candidatus Dojkabacteria bacterium TaxID=2099670 RepID=A0A955I219_9BACT|nr:single-stranded DNA-binding protein [Candidatus Dojkabacteria bacterium]MCB9789807.1 single-stranded DNA-binding protein [Candidatus Nomurabacteria bacterium]MCB9803569.1 single-stranded DNA-binding protein [Candidatus Nomurabacteria bacterium]